MQGGRDVPGYRPNGQPWDARDPGSGVVGEGGDENQVEDGNSFCDPRTSCRAFVRGCPGCLVMPFIFLHFSTISGVGVLLLLLLLLFVVVVAAAAVVVVAAAVAAAAAAVVGAAAAAVAVVAAAVVVANGVEYGSGPE